MEGADRISIVVDSGLWTSKRTNYKLDGSALVPKMMMGGLLCDPDTAYRVLVPDVVLEEVQDRDPNSASEHKEFESDATDLARILEEYSVERAESGANLSRSVVEVIPTASVEMLEARARQIEADLGTHSAKPREHSSAGSASMLYSEGAFCDKDAQIVETAYLLGLPLLSINKKMAYQTNPGPNSLRHAMWQEEGNPHPPLKLVILDNRAIDSLPVLHDALRITAQGGSFGNPIEYVMSLREQRAALRQQSDTSAHLDSDAVVDSMGRLATPLIPFVVDRVASGDPHLSVGAVIKQSIRLLFSLCAQWYVSHAESGDNDEDVDYMQAAALIQERHDVSPSTLEPGSSHLRSLISSPSQVQAISKLFIDTHRATIVSLART